MKAVRDRFALQGGTRDFPSDAVAGKGIILRRRGNHVVFLELGRDSRVTTGRAAPGKSGLHARGEGERVLALESREGTRASRRVEEGLSIRRSNQSILKEISPGISLEGMMLKLKLQYFGHLMRRFDSLEKTLMLGGIGGRKKRG